MPKEELSKEWYRIVGSGDPKHLRAGTRVERIKRSAISYVAKYAQKNEQKQVPEGFQNVGRFWGTWGMKLVQRIIRGSLEETKGLIRLARKASRAWFRKVFGKRPYRDFGNVSWTFIGSAEALRRYLDTS